MEKLIGIRSVDHNGFKADFLWGDAIINQKEPLSALMSHVDADVFKKDVPQAIATVERRFALIEKSAAHANSTSMILYRYPSDPIGEIASYHAYSLQQELEVETSKGPRIVLLVVVRSFGVDFRDHGLGRYDIQQGPVRHPAATAIMYRTISPAAAWSVYQADVVNPRVHFPWQWASLYGENAEAELAGEIKDAGFKELKSVGIAKAKRPPDSSTGAAIADDRPNLAYEVKPGHTATEEIGGYITTVLKAVPSRGDRIYSVGLLE